MPTPRYRLIALDLDGTLLDSEKRLPPENAAALERAAREGVVIVPATGRFYDAVPPCVKALPCARYFITINGAAVLDRQRGEILSRAELLWEQAVEIMSYFDTLPVLYDCYMDGAAWISAAFRPQIAETAANAFVAQMWLELRRPVPELKAHLRRTAHGVQKIGCIFRDPLLRERLLGELPKRFPGIRVTTSYPGSVEINREDANKGAALLALAERLGIPREQTAALGDDRNDLPMLLAAGCGIAMGNAAEEIRLQADLVAPDCDHAGVAAALHALLWQPQPPV